MELLSEPISKRLRDLFFRLNEGATPDVDKRVKIKLYTFIDNSNACDTCKESIEQLNAWFYSNNLDNGNHVSWVIELDMKNNPICIDYKLDKSPTHLICDVNHNIIDINYGVITNYWLDKYIMPIIRGVDV